MLVECRNGSIVEYPNTKALEEKYFMNFHWDVRLDLLDKVVMTSSDDIRACYEPLLGHVLLLSIDERFSANIDKLLTVLAFQ